MIASERHVMPDGTAIAHRFVDGSGPVAVFLPGYMSDMAGSKAAAVFGHAAQSGRACLLLDYSGCGESGGSFAGGTLSRWRDEAQAVIETRVPGRDLLLIGSSMGGWLMLLLALRLGERVKGLIGIAAAPDFTDWGFNQSQKTLLRTGAVLYQDSEYGPEPTPTYPGFWQDGQGHRLLRRKIAIDCPVRLLQGQCDPEVPWQVPLKLARALRSAEVQTVLIKDGDHRLSRDQDIALLLRTYDEMAGPSTPGS